jgi:hypothetical protein
MEYFTLPWLSYQVLNDPELYSVAMAFALRQTIKDASCDIHHPWNNQMVMETLRTVRHQCETFWFT